jgi:phosphoglycolate phosphatase
MDNIKLIIFDFDGVLVDSFQFLKNTYKRIGNVLHIKLGESDEYFRELFELDWMETYKKLNILAKDKINISEFIYHIESNKHKKTLKPYDGIPELLKKLSQKYKLAIVSNSYKEGMITVLERYDVLKYFEIIFDANDGQIKPHPDLLLKCLNHFNIKSNEAFFIGDMDGDIVAGRAAGIKTIAVTYGYHTKQRLKDADYIIDNPNEILSILGL